MTERRARAAREHRSHPAALADERRVADGVHAAVEAVQAARGDTVVHRALAQPEGEELRERDDAILIRSESSYRNIG
jgi:hypothetical protein